MKRTIHSFLALILFSVSLGASAQDGGFMAKPKADAKAAPKASFSHRGVQSCVGPIASVQDVGDEAFKTTAANFNSPAGGGEGGRFDKTPVLSTKVKLGPGCIDAHFSAIVGSRIYGAAPTTVFQVTLTPSGTGAPHHMVGHYETPYGQNAPAIGIGAESDVDMVSANFFQRIGTAPGDLPPGAYTVDVWWAGAGAPTGGAAGAAFVLKLYLR
jgi:hypothetical protein